MTSTRPGLFGLKFTYSLIFLPGVVAGATGAFVGTPAEISLIRMTSDGRLV